jgi:hypothetical protein
MEPYKRVLNVDIKWKLNFFFIFRLLFSQRRYVRREQVRAQVKTFFVPFSRGGSTKNRYAISERMTFSGRVTWDWAERVNLCSGQIILPGKKKHMQRCRSSGRRSEVVLYSSMNHGVNRVWWRGKRILDNNAKSIVQPAATLVFWCWQYRQRACCDVCVTLRSYVLSLGQVRLDD